MGQLLLYTETQVNNDIYFHVAFRIILTLWHDHFKTLQRKENITNEDNLVIATVDTVIL